jgi:hypothetical protein
LQPVERGRILRRPHFLSNANTALQFLTSKRIKLVNINASDLVDGETAGRAWPHLDHHLVLPGESLVVVVA